MVKAEGAIKNTQVRFGYIGNSAHARHRMKKTQKTRNKQNKQNKKQNTTQEY
jgi:hypothetical protein